MTTTILRASAILAAAQTLAAKILLAIPIDRAALTQAMIEAAGGSDADGFWQQRDSFEALEVAIALTAHGLTARSEGASAIRILDSLTREFPTHTVRSEDQIEYQQFSTPPALAMLAVQLARLSADDVFFEPSAGTGIIVSLAWPHVSQSLINEFEPTRASILEGLFPQVSVRSAPFPASVTCRGPSPA